MPREPELTPRQSESVREALHRLLKEEGSQQKLAGRLGLAQATLSRILAGRTPAGRGVARAVAMALGIEQVALLGGSTDRIEWATKLLAADLRHLQLFGEVFLDDCVAKPLRIPDIKRSFATYLMATIAVTRSLWIVRAESALGLAQTPGGPQFEDDLTSGNYEIRENEGFPSLRVFLEVAQAIVDNSTRVGAVVLGLPKDAREAISAEEAAWAELVMENARTAFAYGVVPRGRPDQE